MKQKITKAEWDLLSDADKSKYNVNPENADEYVLVEAAPVPADDPPNPAPSPAKTPAQIQAEIDAAADEKAKKILEQQKAEAIEAERKKNGEFKPLYEELKPKHESLQQRYDSLEKKVKAIIADRKSKLNDKYKALDPNHDDAGNLPAELEWVEKAYAAQTADEAAAPINGNGPGPTPKDKRTDKEKTEATEKALKESGVPRM